MHFNYQHLLRAFEVYEQKYNDLYKSGGNDDDKLRLFSRQVIGFIQRSLPAIDRMAFAQGLYDVVENKAKIVRSFKFKYDNADFPVTDGDSSCSGLGYEYWVFGVCGRRVRACVLLGAGRGGFGKLMSSKKFRLAELMQPRREGKMSRCCLCC